MAKNITKGDLRKQDFLVLKQSRDNTVTKVVAPNGLQVGLSDTRFQNPLTVKGGIQVTDEKSYLRAGNNILLETDSDGQITIASAIDSVAVRRTRLTLPVGTARAAGTDIPFNGSDLNIIGEADTDKFIDVYHNGRLLFSGSVDDVTAGTKDYYIKGSEKIVVFGFDLNVGDTATTIVIHSGSADIPSAGDALSLTSGVYNVNVAGTGGVQAVNDALSIKLSGSAGLATDQYGLGIKIDNLDLLSSGLDSDDRMLIYDHSAGKLKMVAPSLVGATAALDIASAASTLTESTINKSDLFGIADVSDSNAVKKITLEDIVEFISDEASGTEGLQENNGKLRVHIKHLTEAAVDVGTDYIAFMDESDADDRTRKESISDFVSAIRGTSSATGLTSTSGVLSVDINSLGTVGTLNSADQVMIYDADTAALKKTTINDIGLGAVAPPGAEYVTLATNGTLSNERVLTAGDGLTKTDNGAGSTVVLDVDVTDLIDTSHGLKESSNNVQLALKSSGGLTFHSDGTLKLDYGSTSGLPAQGNNAVNIIAGDGLKTGGSFNIGATTSTVQLDIKPVDFAGNGLKVISDDLVVSIGGGDNVTIATGSDGSFIINSSLPPEGSYTAGDGLDLSVGREFSVDLKSGGGIILDSGELAVQANLFAGHGLEDDGSGKLRIKGDSTTGVYNVPIQASAQGASVLIDHNTLEQNSGTIRVKDSGVTNAKLQNSSLTVTAGDGLRTGGSVSLGGSVTLNIDPADFAGTGLKDIGSYNLGIDDSITATLSGSVFSGHVGVTGSIHSTAELSGSVFRGPALSGSLTHLEDGSSYLIAGSNITIVSGSTGAVTISAAADPDVFKTISVAGQDNVVADSSTDALTLAAGPNITITTDAASDTITIAAAADPDVFKTISVSGQDSVVADASTDTLTLAAGSNVTITTDATSDTITIASTDTNTTYAAGNGLDLNSTEFSVDLAPNSGLFVDGSGLSIDDSITATLTGSVFSGHIGVTGSIHSTAELSGSIVRAPSLSGSLTHLEDGSSYIVAGTNIQVATGSSGAITISSTAAGGSITVASGSTSVADASSLKFGSGFIVNEDSSGIASVTASIGAPEDGIYSDGLFTDFGPTTGIGTAIDRFNEVLKGLAPSAAPSLDDVTCADTGTSAKLSFGSSQSISGYTNVAPSGLTPTDNLSNIDINGTFNSTSASNDLRRACFTGVTVINGTLNDDISADGSNYAANAFGNGDQGTLKLYVNNNSTEIHSVNLGSFGSGNSLNGDGSGFTLSAVTNGAFSDGTSFNTFKHRTGTYTIAAASQRNGWNYARITHTIGSTVTTTNYIEWVNDSNSDALSAAGAAMDSLSMTGTKNLSGVKYHTGGTAQYRIRVSNAYKNVYSTSNITFTETRCSVPNQSFPAINYGAGEDESKVLHLTGSVTITADPILNSSISVKTNVPHPLKTNLSNAGNQSISGILLYNLSDTSSTTSETFRGESYRLVSGSYANQAAVTSGGNAWDSTTSLTTVDGLLYYNSRLYAPTQGGVSGDFRSTSDGGSIANGPSSNVNYSGLTTGTKTFYRKFQNTSGGSKTNFDLTINGSGTIVSHGTAFSTSNLKVFAKLPTTGNAFETGWMDLASSFATGQTDDGDGCLVGSLDSSLNATNEITFGTQSVGAGEWIVIIIKTDASFTGHISSMSVSWS